MEDNFEEEIIFIYASVVALILAILALVLMLINFDEDALDAIEERQVEEGNQYTAIVEEYDVSNQLLIMDNGHEIDASEMSKQPDVDNKLSYIKTFDYEIDIWNGMPEETGETAFINIKIMN